ncbi:hypothetical protein BZA05DRAFT_422887 [Tricharina praecox]|uniref:uncharacterized protein n=1 Tax=Tricharina praecox TaxID=43433 RepID=UPI00221EBEAC|nr:uncharacterized protein BZA05DRAFT_422887 [Tricharina praecox]KAI5841273.1 hypothetical protein BZA05DRAFT_422887 [Tricharina praecox]
MPIASSSSAAAASGVAPAKSLSVSPDLLQNFLQYFEEQSGTMNDYRNKLEDFKAEIIRVGLDNGQAPQVLIPWVSEQVNVIGRVVEEIFNIGYHFKMVPTIAAVPNVPSAPVGNPALGPDTLPIDDETILEELVVAMQNGNNPYDMPDTAPLKHWVEDMDPDQMDLIAENFLASHFLCSFYILHGNKSDDEVLDGYAFQQRYESIIEVLNKCKGSVYRMSRPSTMDEIVQNPKKMRQRFIDNQINNAKKKKDSKELKRLRAMWAEVKERERDQPTVPDIDGDSDGEVEAPPRKRKRTDKGKGKAKAPIINTPKEPALASPGLYTPPQEQLFQPATQHTQAPANDDYYDLQPFWNEITRNPHQVDYDSGSSSSAAAGAAVPDYGVASGSGSNNGNADCYLVQGSNEIQPEPLSYEEEPIDWNEFVDYEN